MSEKLLELKNVTIKFGGVTALNEVNFHVNKGEICASPHELVYTLENNFALGATHIQNALVTQHFGAVDVDDGAQEVFELGGIKGSFGFKNKAFDVIVMVVVMARTVISAVGMFAMGVIDVRMVMVAMPVIVAVGSMAMLVRRMVTMLAIVVMVAIVCQKVWVNV